VEASDNISVLKSKLESLSGIRVEDQRVIFAGKQLENNRSFADYCIQKESTLHLIIKQIGGGSKENIDKKESPKGPWVPINKEIYDFKEDYLDSQFKSLLKSIHETEKPNMDLVKKEFDEVYSVPLLTKRFCDMLVEEIESFTEQMNESAVALRVSRFGFDGSMKNMVNHHITPLVLSLFPQLKETKFEVYPKLMVYQLNNNEDWPIHMDGDIATINICLGKEFEGADLRIFDREGTDNFIDYKHQVGRMVIHLGDNRHSVTSLKSGTRYSMIIKLNHIGENY